MLILPITYTDFNGEKRTEKYHFNMSRTELTDLELAYPGGLSSILKSIAAEEDPKKIYDMFKILVAKSYGLRSDDGRSFVKSDKISAEFAQTAAYDQLIMDFFQKDNYAVNFVRGILPAGMELGDVNAAANNT